MPRKDEPQQVQPLTVTKLDRNTIRAPAATADSNELLHDVKKDEKRATAYGTDPDAFYRSLGNVRHSPIYKGRGKDKQQVGTKESFGLDKKAKARFEKAQADFEGRGGNKATAESVSRGAGGGSFQTQGDFGPGSIQIGGVKPLGG